MYRKSVLHLLKVIRKFFLKHNKCFRWHLGDYEKHNLSFSIWWPLRGETLIFVCFYGCVVCPAGVWGPAWRRLLRPLRLYKPVFNGILHIRKNTQKSKFFLSQTYKWKKIMFFVIPEMPSKTFVMLYKKLPDHFKQMQYRFAVFFLDSVVGLSWTRQVARQYDRICFVTLTLLLPGNLNCQSFQLFTLVWVAWRCLSK